MISIADSMSALDESVSSIEAIATDALISPRQVLDCIPKLEALGELAVLRGEGRPGLGGRTNLYRFPLMPPSHPEKKSHEKCAPLSSLAPPQLPRESHANSAGLSTHPTSKIPPKAMNFSPERGEKSSLDSSPLPPTHKNKYLSMSTSIDSDTDKNKKEKGSNGNLAARLVAFTQRDRSIPLPLYALLEIDPERIRRADRLGMENIAGEWELNPPSGGLADLPDWLHARLQQLAEGGIRYPKVVLKRLKQIQRGEFILPAPEAR